ncbi:MAG: phosphopantothenoylcysteine decarboxylase [Candidatus Omnitrophica bacterium]|nr:phosphopantothenoylcysteine decarboxylase [Candidatus Omnitrophota bacterium]
MRILITAGATWVKVDEVRIFTNCFTGKSGLYLARELKKKGHSVTLLINPHCTGKISDITSVYYRYFDEFKSKVYQILRKKNYDAIIHMAAVSDYQLRVPKKGKIPSGRSNLILKLVPAEKIVKTIRKLAKEALLIQFKLEANRKGLKEKAYKSLKSNKSDFVVANSLTDMDLGYKAFLINDKKKVINIGSKKALADTLNRIIIKQSWKKV